MPLKVIDREHTGRYTPTLDGLRAEIINETVTDGKHTFTRISSGPLEQAELQFRNEPWERQMLLEILKNSGKKK